MVTCWERTDLLALLCVMFSFVFVTFQYDVLGHVWYLIVSNPDRCLFPYFACVERCLVMSHACSIIVKTKLY